MIATDNKQERIDELVKILREANKVYRTGDEVRKEALMSDAEYDALQDELEILDPENEVLDEIGFIPVNDGRMQDLPVPMASMNKKKTIEALLAWFKSKGLTHGTEMILTMKLDGLSFCVDEKNGRDSWSRGNGIQGQYSPGHYDLINHRNPKNDKNYSFFAIGEVIMSRVVFLKNKFMKDDGTPFVNPRNLVAGKINDKTPNDILKYCDYIRYGLFSDKLQLSKSEQLDLVNELNPVPMPYLKIKAKDITHKLLYDLFHEWNEEYSIDGIIVEVNDYALREKLGRERNGNLAFAVAFKGEFEEVAETEILNIKIEVSKQGYLAPVAEVKPVVLDGATVTNVTLYNFKFVNNMGLGVGSIIKIKRSGMVIPKIVGVVKKSYVGVMPIECPSCHGPVSWDKTSTQLCCTNDECPSQKLNKIIAFFSILEVDNMGEGICEVMYNAGYNSVKKILNLTKEDMAKLPGFAEKKVNKLHAAIHNAVTDVPLSKLQHASGCFKNLGSKKLELLVECDKNSTVDQIKSIEGFSDILAKNYLDGIVKYNTFVAGLPVTVKKNKDKVVVVSDKCKGWNVVFTKVRDKAVEDIIKANGGEIGSGVSKNTTHLVVKEVGGGSSKEVKAEQLNIPIYNLEDFKQLLN